MRKQQIFSLPVIKNQSSAVLLGIREPAEG
jgi:hypothetical protein